MLLFALPWLLVPPVSPTMPLLAPPRLLPLLPPLCPPRLLLLDCDPARQNGALLALGSLLVVSLLAFGPYLRLRWLSDWLRRWMLMMRMPVLLLMLPLPLPPRLPVLLLVLPLSPRLPRPRCAPPPRWCPPPLP